MYGSAGQTDERGFMQIFPNTIAAAATGAVRPEDSGTPSGTGSSSSSSNTATVSANDFLQLLVSELKNQDPTANTDPNEYINQLVQVNSLEQLISINQDLAPLASADSAGSGTPSGGVAVPAQAASANTSPTASATGNLSAPNSGNSASRIASSLETAAKTLAPGSSASPFDSVLSSMRARAQQARTSTSTPVR